MNTIPCNKLVQTKSIVGTFALGLLLAGGTAWTAQALEIIGFNIASPKNSNQNYLYGGDYAGAPGARTNNWNNLLATADGSAANITLADSSISNSAGGIVSGMSVIFHPSTSGGGVYNRGAGGTNDLKMFRDVEDSWNCNGFGQYGYLDITNIPYAKYSIYCYFQPDNGNGTANTRGGFWAITNTPSGAERHYIKNQSNDVSNTQMIVPTTAGSGYVQSLTTVIGSGGVAWSTIDGGNYTVFSNLTNSNTRVWFGGLGNGAGGVDDLGNYVTGGSAAVRFKICGFQIVETPVGVATNVYLSPSAPSLKAGDPTGTQIRLYADLNNGVLGVDETTATGATYSSTDTNVFTVSATGLLKAGTNGTAQLIASFQSLSATGTVTVVGPQSLSIAIGKSALLAGNNQGDTTTASLYATFPDASTVPVNAFKFVSFSTSPGGVCTVTTNGILTAVAPGTVSVTGTYAGLSVTTNSAIAVTAYNGPTSVAAFGVNLTSAGNGMSFHDLSGAPGMRLAYWNNVYLTYGTVTNEIVNPVDYKGNALAGTVVQVLPNNPPQQSTQVLGTRTTNESMMFNTMFDQGANNGTSPLSQLVLSNIPYASYDILLYFYNDNSTSGTNRATRVTINGMTQYRLNSMAYPNLPDNDGNGYMQAVQPASTPSSVVQVPFGNYIRFSDLTDANLTVDWGAVGQDIFWDAASVTRARLTGFQIVKSLGGLTATNVYLPSAVPKQLAGNPAAFPLTLLADFTDGTAGGNITSLAGVSYASSDDNVFTISSGGAITPGLTPGTATLTITYQTNTLTQTITNLGPRSVTVRAHPAAVYLDGVLGQTTAQAKLYATFDGNTNINISSFTGVSFVDQSSAAATLDAAGLISAVAAGTADLGASYLGTTYVTANAFQVLNLSSAPILRHYYGFRDAGSSLSVTDSVGIAHATIHPALGGSLPITMDGKRARFPGDATFATAPYISLPPGIVTEQSDISIVLWAGQNEAKAWARFFTSGQTSKGTDPHNSGNASGRYTLEFVPLPAGTPFSYITVRYPTSVMTVGTGTVYGTERERQVVMVYAPNRNLSKLYIDGTLVGTADATNSLAGFSDEVAWLGVSLFDDATLHGWINELSIYEGALTDAEVAASYAAGADDPYVSTTPTNITSSVSGSTLTLSWPADHVGWRLQVQTNAAATGLSTDWHDVPGSTSTSTLDFPVDPANPSVFFRMVYP